MTTDMPDARMLCPCYSATSMRTPAALPAQAAGMAMSASSVSCALLCLCLQLLSCRRGTMSQRVPGSVVSLPWIHLYNPHPYAVLNSIMQGSMETYLLAELHVPSALCPPAFRKEAAHLKVERQPLCYHLHPNRARLMHLP